MSVSLANDKKFVEINCGCIFVGSDNEKIRQVVTYCDKHYLISMQIRGTPENIIDDAQRVLDEYNSRPRPKVTVENERYTVEFKCGCLFRNDGEKQMYVHTRCKEHRVCETFTTVANGYVKRKGSWHLTNHPDTLFSEAKSLFASHTFIRDSTC